MSRERDIRDFTSNLASEHRASELRSLASNLSSALPGDEALSIERFDATTGNPAAVVSMNAPDSDADFITQALDHVQRIGPVMGLTAEQAPEFVADPMPQRTSTGATAVNLQQRYKGIPIFEGATTVRFRPDGTLRDSVGSNVSIDRAVEPTLSLSASEAVLRAAQYVAEPDEDEYGQTDQFGAPLEPSRVDLSGFAPRVRATFPETPEQATVLEAGPFGADIKASLTWFPKPEGLSLGWLIDLTMPEGSGQYRLVIDGSSGEVLYCRETMLTFAAKGNVYPVDGTAREMTDFPRPAADYSLTVEPPAEFPDEWVESDSTFGNCVQAHLGDAGPSSKGSETDGVLTFDYPDGEGDDQKVLNIFYFNCFMHDFFYLLGFREADGNFQTDNLGRGGLYGDSVDARAHSGPVNGTANMGTPVDGTSPIMNMGLVERTGRHTAFDSDVVFHEFTHGVTNRLVGGGMNSKALQSRQSRGMGEGWSDYIACTVNDHLTTGAWVVDDPAGIRGFPYDESFPDDFGKLGSGRYLEVHNIGEIWCATLVEINRQIGKELAVQLVVDALKLTPANPSFLQARDAIVEALAGMQVAGRLDAQAHEEAESALWAVFARFGMGPKATSFGAQLTGITPDFEPPAR